MNNFIPCLQRTGGIPLHRSRHREDPVKRGSDSLLDAKIKEQLTKPRSLTNRAQSLDLTLSLSRISEQASRLPPPPSPTGSTATSSPTSVTAPLFPSVYAPPNAGLGGTGLVGSGVPGTMGSINVGGSAVSLSGSGGGGNTGVIGSHRQQSSLSSLQMASLAQPSQPTSASSVASSASVAAAAAVTAAAVVSTQNQSAADEVARVISNLRL